MNAYKLLKTIALHELTGSNITTTVSPKNILFRRQILEFRVQSLGLILDIGLF